MGVMRFRDVWRHSLGRTLREFLEHRHPKVVFLQLLFLSADGLQLSLVLVGEGDVELPAQDYNMHQPKGGLM